MGPELVRRLLPQAPPFLMVDRVDAFDAAGPALRASRFLTANEPVFGGHFPQLALLPGAFMVEGASQAASLCYVLHSVHQAYLERGHTLEDMHEHIANLQRGFSFHPGYRPNPEAPVLEVFERVGGLPVGVSGGIRFKFLRPVMPGCRLVYEVRLKVRMGDQLQFEVGATVDDAQVMTGSVAAAVVPDVQIPLLDR